MSDRSRNRPRKGSPDSPNSRTGGQWGATTRLAQSVGDVGASIDALAAYERDGDRDALEAAIALARPVTQRAHTTTTLPLTAARTVLGCAHLYRHLETGRAAELTSSLRNLQRAIESMDATDPLMDQASLALIVGTTRAYVLEPGSVDVGALLDLARTEGLVERLLRSVGHIEVWRLDAAITVLGLQLDDESLSSAARGRLTDQLSRAHRMRFERRAELDDLDAAINRALEATSRPGSDEQLAGRHWTLAIAKCMAYEFRGDRGDLLIALQSAEKSVELTADDAEDRSKRYSELGLILQVHFTVSGNLDDLTYALDCYAKATASAKDPSRPALLDGYASLVGRIGRLTGDEDTQAKYVAAARKALEASPANDNRYARANLASALRLHGDSTGSLPELDESIKLREELLSDGTALSTKTTFEQTGALARSYMDRFLRSQDVADLQRMSDLAAARAGLSGLSPAQLAIAYKWLGTTLGLAEQWTDAIEAYQLAIEHLNGAAYELLTRADQERVLSSISGLAAEAAVACVEADQGLRGFLLFAAARGVLLRAKRFREQALKDLRGKSPELAQEFEAALETSARQRRSMDLGAGGVEFDALTQKSLALAAEKMQLLAVKAGIDLSLAPQDPFALQGLDPEPGGNPLIAIAVGTQKTVIHFISHEVSGGITATVGRATVVGVVGDFLTHADTAQTSSDAEAVSAARVGMAEALQWIGDSLISPAVEEFQRAGIDLLERSIEWCVTGHLNLLPLAAVPVLDVNSPSGQRVPLVELAAMSLVSHIGYLNEPVPDLRSSDLSPALLVAMQWTPGMRPLSRAVDEVLAVRDLVAPEHCIVMGDDPATPPTHDQVVSALQDAKLVHFACHARTGVSEPSQARILLSDHEVEPLSVSDIAAARFRSGGLAFLSACGTGQALNSVQEEPFDFGSAFELGGFRRVVATLWPVYDSDSQLASHAFYEALLSTGTGDAGDQLLHPAKAIRAATLMLRERHPDDVLRWASHFLLGPG